MALGPSTFSAAGGAVSDLFAVSAYGTRAKGNRLQAETYDSAAGLARQNEEFTKTSTAIKTMQAQRGIYHVLGQQGADVAAGGFEASGSALDVMRDSAMQGALHKAVLGQQGLIEEASYEQQAKSYDIMARSARMAADADDTAAFGAGISGVLKGISAVASVALAPATGGASLAALPALGGGGRE